MRQLKQIGLAVALALVLGTSAMAGIITSPPIAEPPPPPSEPATATGIIETPPSAQATSDATDPVIDFALTMLLLAF